MTYTTDHTTTPTSDARDVDIGVTAIPKRRTDSRPASST